MFLFDGNPVDVEQATHDDCVINLKRHVFCAVGKILVYIHAVWGITLLSNALHSNHTSVTVVFLRISSVQIV